MKLTEELLQSVWDDYQNAWGAVTPAQRERLLRCVAEDCTFSNPLIEGRGRAELTRRMEEFQQARPGAFFNTPKLLIQHGQALGAWTLFDAAGQPLTSGTNYIRVHEGLINQVAGFFEN
jgi:hypothetical protein